MLIVTHYDTNGRPLYKKKEPQVKLNGTVVQFTKTGMAVTKSREITALAKLEGIVVLVDCLTNFTGRYYKQQSCS